MKTIKIRELRGSTLEQHAQLGELVGIARGRALIAVVVPVAKPWIEHVVDHSWSQVLRSASSAEGKLDRSNERLTTLDQALWVGSKEVDRNKSSARNVAANGFGAQRGNRSSPRVGASPAELVSTLKAALLGPGSESEERLDTETVRIGDLSAGRIDDACQRNKLLALTNSGMLIGIVIPVSARLVEFLVTQNLSRVIYNVQRAEGAIDRGDVVVLDDLDAENLDPAAEARKRDSDGR